MTSTEEARIALETKLDELAMQLGDEELRVLLLLGRRLLAGMATYGPLDLARDRRDLALERAEELMDAEVYSAMSEIRRLIRRGEAHL